MKKLFIGLVLLLAAGSMFANPIQLGNFPVGQWLDANYDAVWDFSTNNIRILNITGKVLYDFSDKTIEKFSVFMEGIQPGISFTCPEAKRSYRFIKPLANSDLIMEIARSEYSNYTITMKKQ
jgi:hypothetical protein